MSAGDVVKGKGVTIRVKSGNLESAKDKDFDFAKCVLGQLGFKLPSTENGIYWADFTPPQEGYTWLLDGIALDDLNFSFVDLKYKGSSKDPGSGKFTEFLVTLWHEIKGHNIDEGFDSPEFDAKYEAPVKAAIKAAKNNDKWEDIVKKCSC